MACATVAYDGPRRPSEEVAHIEESEVAIRRIDRFFFEGVHGQIEVLPGPHRLVVELDAWHGGRLAGLVHERSGLVSICLRARPGRTYLVRPARFDDRQFWGPEIIDERDAVRVAARAPGDPVEDCRPQEDR